MEQQADIQQTFNFEIERIYAGHFMLLAVCALFVRAAACSPLLEAEAVKLGRQHLMPFQGFKAEFRKSYRTEQEEVAKFRTYVETVQTVNKHNDEFKRGRHSFKLRLNQFADMSDDEFTTVMASCTSVKFPRFAASKGSEVTKPQTKIRLQQDCPYNIDYRNTGSVGPVKDQLLCGACYAFAAVGVIESAYQRLMHDFVAFSEQNLIDCDAWKWATGNDGCRGGNLENSFTFVQKHGLDTEKQYPFKGRTSGLYCYQKHNNEIPWMGPPSIVAIKRIRELELEEGTMNSEAEVILKSTLCHQGPLSVAIFLNKRDRSKFKSHGEGIFEAEDPTKCVREPGDVALAHAVLLAGYGRDQSPGVYKDYWLVKNSWGTAWGEAGYVRMRRNYVNCFNLANMVYWVVLDKNRTYPRNITRP